MHISVFLVKTRNRLVCSLQTKTRAQLPVLLYPAPCTQPASLHLGWTRLPSAEPLGCRGRIHGFAEPQFKEGAGCAHRQAPTLWPALGSCLALNLSTGAAREINCSTTQCFSNLHVACHCFSNQSLCSLMMFIKTC